MFVLSLVLGETRGFFENLAPGAYKHFSFSPLSVGGHGVGPGFHGDRAAGALAGRGDHGRGARSLHPPVPGPAALRCPGPGEHRGDTARTRGHTRSLCHLSLALKFTKYSKIIQTVLALCAGMLQNEAIPKF